MPVHKASARSLTRGSCLARREFPTGQRGGHEVAFNSTVFQKEKIVLGGTEEWIVRGGRHLFPLLPKAFAGIRQIGVIGWSSQGPAQAQNLRESLAGSGIRVKVGLRAGSGSIANVEKAGFTEANGTRGEMYEVIAGSDLVLLLISDAAQADNFDRIMAAIRPGATLGLSHGFLVAYVKSAGTKPSATTSTSSGCARRAWGRRCGGSTSRAATSTAPGSTAASPFIRTSTGSATDYALAGRSALGSPCTFETTLEFEYKSDIFGERGILLGAVHGICESLYRWFRHERARAGRRLSRLGQEHHRRRSAKQISAAGLLGVYEALDEDGRQRFKQAYCACYGPAADILHRDL